MPQAKCRFRQTELVRARKAVQSAGHEVHALEIKPDGTILIRTAPDVDAIKEAAGGETLLEMIRRGPADEEARAIRERQAKRRRRD